MISGPEDKRSQGTGCMRCRHGCLS